MLLVGYKSGEIRLWDLISKKPLGSMAGKISGITDKSEDGSLSMSPDGRLLAASGVGPFVTVYDVAKRAAWKPLSTDANGTLTVAFSPDGRRLAALGADNRLYVWEIARDSATLYLSISAVPGWARIHKSAEEAEPASWLDWMSNDRIALANHGAAIAITELNPENWLQRIDGLALPVEATIR
jgi:WD40 repeat protein